MKPTRELLLNRYIFDPATGIFTWKHDSPNHRYKAGSIAGSTQSDGYIQISIDGKLYKRAHLSWFLKTGEWHPKGMIVDHINRVRTDDSWDNLRLITKAENCQNRNMQRNNTSGYPGV